MRRVLAIIISLTYLVFTYGCISIEDLLPPQPDWYVSEGDELVASSAKDLAASGETANCYIVSSSGTYKFKPVKGNSSESVGSVASVVVLWESFGTSAKPSRGDLIKSINYDSDVIVFSTADGFREGNAVIAAKDASGTILWSWHIWLTDQPEGQEYYNNAGTMMDRNLGATSATPGDVGALGLFYQWGRKDPFLGSSSISSSVEAQSTATWSIATSSTSTGNIDYATANPMTFISESSDGDWHYSSRINDLWKSDKTIYDPCPAGWRVPDDSVWSNACGSSSHFDYSYDSINKGMNFSYKFGNSSIIWYPASNYRDCNTGGLFKVGNAGRFWSSTSGGGTFAFYLSMNDKGEVYPSDFLYRACGMSVRCFKEDSAGSFGDDDGKEHPEEEAAPGEGYDPGIGNKPSASSASDLNSSGKTANSYIVSSSGTYKFKPVKGNSSESVGSVASVVVLWESFGTSAKPSRGDLIKSINYDSDVIVFSTADGFREGNAVIAAKDASGTILWSWHIWLTDQPEGQEYYNNAGTMMDRNLGATSATPGDVGALGLFYQWGRKDPFLGSSSISSSVEAKSTATWPSAVTSSISTGNVEYATANPMIFINGSVSSDYDWHYSSRNDDLWKSDKTIYDPCPTGWRVPDGNVSGVWAKACGKDWTYDYIFSEQYVGMDFSGEFGYSEVIWYPATGSRTSPSVFNDYNTLANTGVRGEYWSISTTGNVAHYLHTSASIANPCSFGDRYNGYAVRCIKD